VVQMLYTCRRQRGEHGHCSHCLCHLRTRTHRSWQKPLGPQLLPGTGWNPRWRTPSACSTSSSAHDDGKAKAAAVRVRTQGRHLNNAQAERHASDLGGGVEEIRSQACDAVAILPPRWLSGEGAGFLATRCNGRTRRQNAPWRLKK
jgi:hypothetical protein